VNAVRDAGDLCCVVLDIAMPVMSGWDAARTIRTLRPGLPLLLSSGHDLDAALGHTQGIEFAGCLKKPYSVDALERALAAVRRGSARPV
jgi:CheY-like chemotaxis protein